MALPSIEEIAEYNPWVKDEKFEVPKFRRRICDSIKNEVERRKFIIAIVGLRRVGKTVLMKQIGNEIGGEKFFFSFDEEKYQTTEALKFVISHFLRISKLKPTVFLDEIGRIRGWAGVIKKYHDLNKANFVVSSSSYLHVTKGKESLAGRLNDFNLLPWSFDEYLNLIGKRTELIEESNIERAYTAFKNEHEEDLGEYIKKGSFPEIAFEKDERRIKKYVKNLSVEKIVFEDLPKIFPIEHVDKVYDILIYIARNSGSIVNYSSLASILNISKDTVKRYLFYLEKALLVRSVDLFGSYAKALRKGKKFYVACSPISFAYQEYYDEPRLVENVVLSRLLEFFDETKFYRDSLKREIDFVVKKIPIEVKWKSEIVGEDLKNVFFFAKKYNSKFGVIISKKFDIVEKNSIKIYALPLQFFLSLDLEKALASTFS